ncbi:GMC family oxidoreductase [Sphingomonas sp.]|jgi:choline dehydrogenase-like flavoprotein|uniref:GMC family oxidoreductase n=1 Tax=Sphingomonas sp. TaxID=28214 RepID=UPI002DE581F8|nr:GMC family oxidoreductase [Sphingomonas sp.]
MLIDFRKEPESADLPADVCIVGGGAAGVTLARRLLERGQSVILIESGGLDFEEKTQKLYKGANVGMPYYDLEESRLRFFGGTVSIWGGRAALLDEIDFAKRAWVPHSGWPITRHALMPYYRQAHDIFELGEFNYENDIWGTLGLGDPGFDPDKLGLDLWRFDEASERFAAARTKDLFEHPRIRILLHANAVKVQADPSGRTIDQVSIQSLDGPARPVRARRYVLAAGAIENSRLLLVSNDVEPHGIGNARDQVGRFFMEHPCGRIGKVETDRPYELWDLFQKRFMRKGPPLAPVLRLSDATQEREQALNSIVTFKLQGDPAKGVAIGNKVYHNLKHAINPSRGGRRLDHAYRGIRAWFHRTIRGAIEQARAKAGMTDLYLIVRGEQAPNPDSRVLLSNERDTLGHRRADLSWQLLDADKHTARVFAKIFGEELQRLGRGWVTPSPWLLEPGAQWPVDPTVGNHPIAGYHHIGGTRMSEDPATGVVDPNCRAHGYDNLYVAGSSSFSTGGWANPTLTIVALSLRLGDHLAGA